MGIASLGAFASGLGQGAERGLTLAGMAEDRAYVRGQRERQAKLQAREDQDLSAIDEANAAGAAVLKGYQDEWAKSNPTLGGQPAQPFQATPQMILDAGRARTDTLLKKLGPTDAWAKAWSQDEAMRGQVRQQAALKVRQSLTTGADPTNAVREFFDTLDDGTKVTGVTMDKGADGKPVLKIDRANRYTGQPVDPIAQPADQIVQDLIGMAANPADLAKHSMAMTLERFKQAGALNLEGARQEGRMKLAETNNAAAGQRTERSAQATEKAAELRVGSARSTANAEAIRALGQERTSVDNDIRTLTQQLKDARPTDRPAIKQQLDDARVRAQDVRKRLSELSSGGAAPAAAPPAPRAPGAPSGLPAGARQIGTSGGKPVYETPDGKRFIEE